MDPKHLFHDDRSLGCCVYCGGLPDTRDHVPSKVFLEDPFPEQLPIVDACSACNNGFSLDEEYTACFLEAVLAGSAAPKHIARSKISRAFARNSKLCDRIQASRQEDGNGGFVWFPEVDRVNNVMLKLARGHAAYELSLPQIEEPHVLAFRPLQTLGEQERLDFEYAGSGLLRRFPEIGSRAFIRACREVPSQHEPWVFIQEGRYRYAVDQIGGVVVRIVIAEYLACTVTWE